jgi:acetoin utilization protein AcuB
MIVSMWMTRELATVGADTTVAEAAEIMRLRHIRRLVVVAAPGSDRLLGIVTVTDVLHAFPPDVNPFAADPSLAARTQTLVGALLRHEPVTVAPDDPIERAAELMRERKISGLPVVRDGRLVGLITASDIFRAFVSLFTGRERGLRVTFDASSCEHPFALIAQIAAGLEVEVRSFASASEHDHPVCVVHVEGPGAEAFVERLWSSHRRVLNVLPLGAETTTTAP